MREKHISFIAWKLTANVGVYGFPTVVHFLLVKVDGDKIKLSEIKKKKLMVRHVNTVKILLFLDALGISEVHHLFWNILRLLCVCPSVKTTYEVEDERRPLVE